MQEFIKYAIEAKDVPVVFQTAFGASYDTAFWYGVGTDEERERLTQEKSFFTWLNASFEELGYLNLVEDIHYGGPKFKPIWFGLKKHRIKQARAIVIIQSQETVDKSFDGKWWRAMK